MNDQSRETSATGQVQEDQRPIIIQTQVNVLPRADTFAGVLFWGAAGAALVSYVWLVYGGY